MKLTELNPRWLGHGGPCIRDAQGNPVPERHGVGISFDCPCRGACSRIGIEFENPLDGGPAPGTHTWRRDGDTFETLTLSPSIQRTEGCGWHGWVRNGVAS